MGILPLWIGQESSQSLPPSCVLLTGKIRACQHDRLLTLESWLSGSGPQGTWHRWGWPPHPLLYREDTAGNRCGLDVRALVQRPGEGRRAPWLVSSSRSMKEASLQGECWPGQQRHSLHNKDITQCLLFRRRLQRETSVGQGPREIWGQCRPVPQRGRS